MQIEISRRELKLVAQCVKIQASKMRGAKITTELNDIVRKIRSHLNLTNKS